MKQSPRQQELEQMLRSSRLVAGGFMGTDSRSLDEIIDADRAELAGLGVTAEQLAERMRHISDLAAAGLGTWVGIDEKRRAMTAESKGTIVCPWPHSGCCFKTVTTVEDVDRGRSVRWSDLSIHLIAEHCFFEGRGSAFRIEPEQLIKVIF